MNWSMLRSGTTSELLAFSLKTWRTYPPRAFCVCGKIVPIAIPRRACASRTRTPAA
jgi:hypothetical protein